MNNDRVLGIDLGTTNSLVATVVVYAAGRFGDRLSTYGALLAGIFLAYQLQRCVCVRV